ncbi:MAG TPA: hypothetical protein VJM33_11770 [Microthrixaceae bacterium]|nr:hypothetical protein [Microthrixaceae bacterium]
MTEHDGEPTDDVSALRREVWVARDAAIGATAELGTARARVAELEVLVDQLRTELARQDAEMSSRAVRIALALARPLRRLRGVT